MNMFVSEQSFENAVTRYSYHQYIFMALGMSQVLRVSVEWDWRLCLFHLANGILEIVLSACVCLCILNISFISQWGYGGQLLSHGFVLHYFLFGDIKRQVETEKI